VVDMIATELPGSSQSTTVSFTIMFETTDSLGQALGDCKGANECLPNLVNLTISELVGAVSSGSLTTAGLPLKSGSSISAIQSLTVVIPPPECKSVHQDYEQAGCCSNSAWDPSEGFGSGSQHKCSASRDVFHDFGCCGIESAARKRMEPGSSKLRNVVWTEPPVREDAPAPAPEDAP
jgi:hypothetical protein